ncbi:MAG TPA: ankyrin repeat domain-containing protein [Polyangiaceae bacterium]|nr:ankyrin repeat domain-containing protein [Polyangiaceae bacterium]
MKELVTLGALGRTRSHRVKLALSRSGLVNLSASRTQLERVVELDLAYNAFRQWPLAGMSLPALETLSVAQNEISSLEGAGLGVALPNLGSLTLDYNPLRDGARELGELRALRRLSLFSCGLRALPEAVCELSQLRAIELGNNQLQGLPDGFARLVHLERVGLRGNPVGSLEVLGSLPRLKLIEVDFNAEPDALTFLRHLAERGIEVDVRSSSYQVGTTSALQIAAMRGDVAAVARQLRPESMSSWLGYPQYSLLDIACLRGDLALARLLCEAGMDSRRSPGRRYRSTPLHQACSFSVELCHDPTEWEPRVELIRYLVSQGADVEARSSKGLTPLHCACTMSLYSGWGRSDLVRALVAAGANVNAKSSHGETALESAVRLGDYRTATTLLSLGADLSSGEPGLAHLAASHGHARLCEALLEAGAPAFDAQNATCHHAAAIAAPSQRVDFRRRAEVIERAAARGVPVSHQNALGKAALHEACAGHDASIVALLLRLDARLDVQNEAGATPLHVAVLAAVASPTAALRILTMLLEAGADPDRRNAFGDTPLHLAARARCSAVVRLLLRFAASLQVSNDARETPEMLLAAMACAPDRLPPLHHAACQGRRARAAALIASGRIDVNALDAEGRTPLFYAHQVKMAHCLLRLGAQPAIIDASGRSAEVVLREKKKLAAADAIRDAPGV